MAARVCFSDTSIKVSQMPGERHGAIELHNSNEPPSPKFRSRIADIGRPTVAAYPIFSGTEFKDLADEHFWTIKCL